MLGMNDAKKGKLLSSVFRYGSIRTSLDQSIVIALGGCMGHMLCRWQHTICLSKTLLSQKIGIAYQYSKVRCVSEHGYYRRLRKATPLGTRQGLYNKRYLPPFHASHLHASLLWSLTPGCP